MIPASSFLIFYHPANQVVIDAKYKKMDTGPISREDFHQLITYMHVLQNNNGCFIYPAGKAGAYDIGSLEGFGGNVKRFGFKVPGNTTNYCGFVLNMQEFENSLIAFLKGFDSN